MATTLSTMVMAHLCLEHPQQALEVAGGVPWKWHRFDPKLNRKLIWSQNSTDQRTYAFDIWGQRFAKDGIAIAICHGSSATFGRCPQTSHFQLSESRASLWLWLPRHETKSCLIFSWLQQESVESLTLKAWHGTEAFSIKSKFWRSSGSISFDWQDTKRAISIYESLNDKKGEAQNSKMRENSESSSHPMSSHNYFLGAEFEGEHWDFCFFFFFFFRFTMV